MKFLEFTSLERINMFLSNLNLGGITIKGNLEAFSCKHTGDDKKLSISLEHEILDYLGKSVESDPSSPVDYLCARSSRRTLIYLVLTLSHMYPGYDFSAVKDHQYFREEEWETFEQEFDTYMSDVAREWAELNRGSSLLESMRKAIDEVIQLAECEMYSYNPDFEEDPLLEKGAIWSFNFFLYNKKLKRVVVLRCCRISNLTDGDFLPDDVADEEEESDIFTDMDM